MVCYVYGIKTELFGSGIDALEITVTERLNCGNCHTAHESELCKSVLNSSVAGKITGLFFSVHYGSNVCLCFVCSVIGSVRSAVKKNELNIRVLCLCFVNSNFKEITGSYYYLCAAGYSEIDCSEITCIGRFFGLVVLMSDLVFFGILLNAFPCALVKGLIVDISLICYERDIVCSAAAG